MGTSSFIFHPTWLNLEKLRIDLLRDLIQTTDDLNTKEIAVIWTSGIYKQNVYQSFVNVGVLTFQFNMIEVQLVQVIKEDSSSLCSRIGQASANNVTVINQIISALSWSSENEMISPCNVKLFYTHFNFFFTPVHALCMENKIHVFPMHHMIVLIYLLFTQHN